MNMGKDDGVDDVFGEALAYSNGLRYTECDPTWGGRLELGTCKGCRRDAMLPVGLDKRRRWCIACVMGRTAGDKPKPKGKRRQYHRYQKCREPDCVTMVIDRKSSTGYCMTHARRRRMKKVLKKVLNARGVNDTIKGRYGTVSHA